MVNCVMCEHELTKKDIEASTCPHCLFQFNVVIAVPLSEDGVHKIFEIDCACHPKVRFNGLDLVIFHPLMGVEQAVEWAQDIINKTDNP